MDMIQRELEMNLNSNADLKKKLANKSTQPRMILKVYKKVDIYLCSSLSY